MDVLTIAEIKALREQGSRKWGKDLYLHVRPMVAELMSVEMIKVKLLKEHDLAMTTDQLKQIIYYYRHKLKPSSPVPVPAAPPPFQASKPFAQNQEASNPLPLSSPPPVRKKIEFKKSYVIPDAEPKSVTD